MVIDNNFSTHLLSDNIDLIHQVNDYWEVPLSDLQLTRLEAQVQRMF